MVVEIGDSDEYMVGTIAAWWIVDDIQPWNLWSGACCRMAERRRERAYYVSGCCAPIAGSDGSCLPAPASVVRRTLENRPHTRYPPRTQHARARRATLLPFSPKSGLPNVAPNPGLRTIDLTDGFIPISLSPTDD